MMKKIAIASAILLILSSASWAAQFGVALVYAEDVTLAWDASPAPDIATYSIYRSATSGSYESTNLVGTVNHPEVTFTDLMVPDGTWYWVGVPVDTSGNPGPWSDEVTKTIDTTPPPKLQNFRIQ
jgi:hypothetical protein